MNAVDLAFQVGVPLASVTGWAVVYWIARWVTRPVDVTEAEASMELPGPESPAVVSLLANRWAVTADAAESTLLDLAARGHLELRQPGADPRETTVHPTGRSADGLNGYERHVLDRVTERAVYGVVPLTALAFADEKRAATWSGWLGREVVADARRLGLSRRRFPKPLVTALGALGALAAVGVAAGFWYDLLRTEWVGLGVIWFFTTAAFSSVAGRDMGERDTAYGRAVAARWLGVRRWLTGHEAFGDLPPAAVAVWDRYLSYGAALGATRAASEVVHLGLADRRRLWSSYGGAWRRVSVSYPHTRPRYGQSLGWIFFRAVGATYLGWTLAGVVGPALVSGGSVLPTELDGEVVGYLFDQWHEPWRDLTHLGPIPLGLILVGMVLLGYAAYTFVRVFVDLFTAQTVTGEVIWHQVRTSMSSEDSSDRIPVDYYLVVDDGRTDRTRAWIAPAAIGKLCELGDVVSVRVRQWTRRVNKVTVLRPARPAPPRPGGAASVSPAAGGGSAQALLTLEELGRAVGRQVRPAREPGYSDNRFTTVDFNDLQGELAVSVGLVRGRAARVIMVLSKGIGQPLPGIGDEAYVGSDRVIGRRGEVVVLLRPGRHIPPHQLVGLLPLALARSADGQPTRTG
ncbi:DUF2207 family protein [Micromonospora sp. NPDC050397]|uniref:DUF2207 family protein n=1 Tax=Micromonospora sp. NPDC050397 TaxID=3364279 RepID=UPI00384A6FE3